nr:hypothetical protein [Anaerocolumna aminovalerica]
MAGTSFGRYLCRSIYGYHTFSCQKRRPEYKKVVYIAIDIDMNGRKDVLGMCVG